MQVSVIIRREHQLLRWIEIDPPGAEVGADRQLSLAAVRQNSELDAGRTAIVEQFVDRRPRRAPGVQYVVDQNQWPALDIKGNRGRLDPGMQAFLAVVVTVEGDVDQADFVGLLEQLVQATGNPGATTVNADEHGIRAKPGSDQFGEFDLVGVRGAEAHAQGGRLGAGLHHGRMGVAE